MLLKMSVKIGLLTKTPFTKGAFERFLFVVNISNMSLKIRRNRKRPFAVFAFVGLLTRVGPKVSGQISRAGEDFATKLASVSVLGLGMMPGQHVRITAETA